MCRLLIAALVIAAAPAFADVDVVSGRPSIHVTGVGTAEAAPDKIDMFIQLVTVAPSVELAMAENATRLTAMMSATKAAGIAGNDVQLSSVSVTAGEEYDREGRPKGPRYTVQKQFVLCLRAPAKLDALLIELSKAKAVVSNIQFVSQALQTQQDALAVKAMENAKKKAEQLAGAVGSKVGRLLRAVPSSERATMQAYSTGGGVSVGASATGAQRSTVSIEVDFELEPGGK